MGVVEYHEGVVQIVSQVNRLLHDDRPEFSNGDRNLGRLIASQTATILENQALVQRLERYGDQMAATLVSARQTVPSQAP